MFYKERIFIFVLPNFILILNMNNISFFNRFFVLLLFCIAAGFTNAVEQSNVITISGKVIDASQRRSKPLSRATIQLSGINISTITNQDGVFLLKVPLYTPFSHIEIKHIGYSTLIVKAEDIDLNKQNIFRLNSHADKPVSAEYLIDRALEYINSNYTNESTAKIAFYRESVKKKRKYLSLAETILDISKTSYASFLPDLIRLYKGRKITDYEMKDTLLFKFEGGIPAIMSMDMVKRRDVFFDKGNREWYNYQLIGTTHLDYRLHYIVSFNQAIDVPEILYRGEVYIDAENYAIARVKFNMNVENNPRAASDFFVQNNPDGVKIKVTEAAYLVDFKKDDNGYSFHSAQLDIKYRCKWKKKAISSTYSVAAEIIITNEVDQHLVIRDNLLQVHAKDVLAEKTGDFEDADFWDAYNIIEPDKQVTKAIEKLLKASKKGN